MSGTSGRKRLDQRLYRRYIVSVSMSFRQIITKEAERRGWSAYRLAQESGLAMRTVQKYLAGDCDVASERAAAMFDALGLHVVRKTK